MRSNLREIQEKSRKIREAYTNGLIDYDERMNLARELFHRPTIWQQMITSIKNWRTKKK